MKTLPIMFFISLVSLLYSCEVPKEKVLEKEEVVKSVDTITKKEEKFRQNDNVSDKLKKIYEMYGCLNKDNFQSNGFDKDGKEKFILYVNGKYISMSLECDTKRCWLSDINGECSFRTRYEFIDTSEVSVDDRAKRKPKKGYFIKDFEFSCDELYQGVYFNKSSDLSNQ